MAGSILGTVGREQRLAARTPGSLGYNDAADPNAPIRAPGDTPGPLGVNDHADPNHVQRIGAPPGGVLRQFDAPAVGGPAGEKAVTEIAIELFRANPESSSKEGQAVLSTLDELFKKGNIKFDDLSPGLAGFSNKGLRTITMNRYLLSNPARLSIWLVHEAYHLAGLGTRLYIDEEIHSRELQARYWKSIAQGVTFRGKTYSERPGHLVEVYEKNQIVDWVLPQYADDEDFLQQGWIGEHIGDWGGPANRTMDTRKKYIDVLLEKPRKENIGPGARALFAILEASPVPDARALLVYAGGGNLSKGAERISERIALALHGSASMELWDRIIAWQKKTGFDLGFKSETPKR